MEKDIIKNPQHLNKSPILYNSTSDYNFKFENLSPEQKADKGIIKSFTSDVTILRMLHR